MCCVFWFGVDYVDGMVVDNVVVGVVKGEWGGVVDCDVLYVWCYIDCYVIGWLKCKFEFWKIIVYVFL